LAVTQRKGLASAKQPATLFAALDTFSDRHIGPDNAEAAYMLSNLGYSSMDAFVDDVVPSKIRIPSDAVSDNVIGPLSEAELLRRAKLLGAENKQYKSYIGLGYHNAVVPPVILRNVSPRLTLPRNTILFKCPGHGEPSVVYPVYTISS